MPRSAVARTWDPAFKAASSTAVSQASRSGWQSAVNRATIRVASSSFSIWHSAFFFCLLLNGQIAELFAQNSQSIHQFVEAAPMLDLLPIDGDLSGIVQPTGERLAVFLEGVQRVRSAGSLAAVGTHGLNMLFGHAAAPDLLQTGEFLENLLSLLSNGG
jgi:hypothetical protein